MNGDDPRSREGRGAVSVPVGVELIVADDAGAVLVADEAHGAPVVDAVPLHLRVRVCLDPDPCQTVNHQRPPVALLIPKFVAIHK